MFKVKDINNKEYIVYAVENGMIRDLNYEAYGCYFLIFDNGWKWYNSYKFTPIEG